MLKAKVLKRLAGKAFRLYVSLAKYFAGNTTRSPKLTHSHKIRALFATVRRIIFDKFTVKIFSFVFSKKKKKHKQIRNKIR